MTTLDTLNKLNVPGPDYIFNSEEWLVIRGDRIVGVFEADCVECAWEVRDMRFKGCQVAMVPNESRRRDMCVRKENALRKLQREEQKGL